MKKKLLQLGGILLIALILVGASISSVHAATASTQLQAAAPSPGGGILTSFLGETGIQGFLDSIIATGMNWALTGMGFVLALSGWLLNFSISLTLHIKEFVNATPAIYTTWRAIRDMSGIIIIFLLLYAAMQMILGVKSSSFGSLVKNIVVIGLLINFSFFFAGLGIDASNIVSIQIYNAIAPANSLNAASATYSKAQNGTFSTIDGGISNIFMTSLRMQTVYQSTSAAPSPTTQIIVAGIVGVMIELVAALSFAAAAVAFIFRFVVLLLLLAFSPIWILGIGNAIPGVGAYSSRWTKHYGAMLQFMPVYLLLMYLGMSILASNPNGLFIATAIAGSAWYGPILALGVNAFLVCFMLNMPLVVAAGMGDIATKFIPKSFHADAIWKGFGNKVGTASYRGTVSRAASKIATSDAFKDVAANSRIGALALKGTRTVAADYDKKLAGQVETRTKFAESLGYNQKNMNDAQAELRNRQQQLANAKTRKDDAAIDKHEKEVGESKARIAIIEKSRQDAYAKTIGGIVQKDGSRKGGGSYDTLYMYVARKNKAAGAKIQIPVLEKQLTQQKESLKETQADIKELQKSIRNNPAVKDSLGNETTKAGTPNAEQAKELDILLKDEEKKIGRVNGTSAQMDELKLIK